MKSLENKIQNKTAKIGVIGLGYVGLPLAIEFVKAGYHVVGIDIDKIKINSIRNNKNYINDVDDNLLKKAVIDKKLIATSDFSIVKELDTISICVPTPLNKQKDPDISFIISVMDKIKNYIHEEMAIILESTTYPGSTKELMLPYVEKNGFSIGKDIYLCFSPERIDPGNKNFNTSNTPKVIGGITKKCSDIGEKLYSAIINEVIKVSSTETAEMVKLLENTFRAINIGLANEVAIICEKLGVNVWEVIDAAATKPFGFMKFFPGPGLGGHCIPIDPHYLAWKLKTLDYDARFIQLAGEINTYMPKHVIELISESLNKKQKALNGSKVLIIGVAYKKDIDDYRESPALDIIQLLIESGANADYFDPHIPVMEINNIKYSSLENIEKYIHTYDICTIITDHSSVDYNIILEKADLIVDTRNVYKNILAKNINRLGEG